MTTALPQSQRGSLQFASRRPIRADDRHLDRSGHHRLGCSHRPAGEARRPFDQRREAAECSFGRFAVRPFAGYRGEGDQGMQQRGRTRGVRVVRRILGADDESLGVVGGVEEPALTVGEVVKSAIQDTAGAAEPNGVAGDAKDGEERLGDAPVVLQDRGRSAGNAVTGRPHERVPAGTWTVTNNSAAATAASA